MVNEITSNKVFTADELKKHFKVYAGPGAGKTHLLVNNIKHIINHNEKIKNSRDRKVLCITYTNAAVDEIKGRLEEYAKNVEVTTIHGFIIKYIIKPYQTELRKHMKNDFGIDINSKCIISSQIEGLGILHGHNKDDIYKYINCICGSDYDIDYGKKIMGEVEIDTSKFTNEGEIELKSSSRILDKHKLPIKDYLWRKVKKLTHNEVLFFGYKIPVNNDIISYALRIQFPFIFVDEFQDTNPLQTKLIEHLGLKGSIIGVIGDKAQSIYSFQGAKPSQFDELNIGGDINTIEYIIRNNRRSTKNIVNMCNYIRKDERLIQESISNAGTKKVVFLCGDNEDTMMRIKNITIDGGVVLTRTWAAAFNYIDGVSDQQKDYLRRIYNSYFTSPIDIRAEIAEHNNVNWVRAFKFIILLWDGYNSKSLGKIINALDIYIKSNSVKSIITKTFILLNSFLVEVFADVSNNDLTVDIIKRFNRVLNKDGFKEIKLLFIQNFKAIDSHEEELIECFTEQDREDLIANVSSLEWCTSYKLFTEVFTKDSRYMTVHQAKGKEWSKVIVSVEPSVRNDKITFVEMICNPKIARETCQDEFTRIFYVACSRAKDELYIHLKNESSDITNMLSSLEEYIQSQNIERFYEVVQ